jgi:hypothetical protein
MAASRPDTATSPATGGGFKRKGKQQRGPRSFVGPMDHSYRAVNGNFAETPPSTIESHGNYQGRSNGGGGRSYQRLAADRLLAGPAHSHRRGRAHQDLLLHRRPLLQRQDQETARKLGVKVAFVKNDKDAIAELTSGEEEDRPGLIVFDLNNANAKPLTLIPKLKAKLKKSTSIIGFLSHLQGDLKAKAVEAGCDTVMPRAAFSQNLPNLLRRYGIAEEEEAELQPVPLAWGPLHVSAAEEMQVQVVDRLAAVAACIHDHAVAGSRLWLRAISAAVAIR